MGVGRIAKVFLLVCGVGLWGCDFGLSGYNELPFDPNMFALEDVRIFNFSSDDKDDGTVADMNNLDTTIQVSPIPTTRIHKDYLLDKVIGDLQSATQTRKMSKNLEEHGFVSTIQQRTNHKELQNFFFACFLSQEEPKKVIHALKYPSWIEAMQKELLQFKLQEVGTLVDLPNGKRAIGTKWAFKNKKDARRIMIRNKARLVAQGYTQEEGIDYDEVFDLVVRIEAIWMFLAYALFKDFVVYQMDVKVLFSMGRLKNRCILCQPSRFEDPDFPDRVYKVKKALYGLHQLLELGMKPCQHIYWTMGFKKGKLTSPFSSKGTKKKDGTFISQDKYVAKILKKFRFLEVKIASTPIETQKPLLKDEDGEEDEGSSMPTDPHHTPTILQPSSSQPQQTQKPMKPKRKDTQVPQPSSPTESVAYEVVHKELDDKLVRAATTASSLEAKCQETIRDTTAQTRFESVSKHSNDSLLARDKATQKNEIDSLKRKVKKLEKRNKSRTHKLKRLYKAGLTAMVESSGDEESLGEYASKQGMRIDAIDADKHITLVNDADNEMFDMDDLGGEEVFVAEQEVVSTAATTETITTKEITLAQALKALKTLNTRQKGLFFISQLDERLQAQEQAELSHAEKATLFQQLLKRRRKHFAAKRAEEKRNKPPTQAQKRKIMCTYLKNMKGYKLKDLKLKEFDKIKEMFDRAFKRVNTFEDIKTELVKEKERRAEKELIQENEEKVAIDGAIPLAVKSLRIVRRSTKKERKAIIKFEITKDGKVIASKELVRNLPKFKFDQHFCDACKIRKQAHDSHKAKKIVSTTRCLKLLHIDIFGLFSIWSYGGNHYTLVIVDDYSRYTWTRFFKDKTKAFDKFEIFSKKNQNQLGCTIVSIRTDHGKKFDNEVQFGEFCNTNGITHNFSAPRTPQSNGVVKRKNRKLQEMSRTMLNEQSLPQKFWCNAADTSTYILNRILIRAIIGKTPYKLLRGRKRTLDYFRVFESKCFILNTKDYLTKFDPNSYEGVFLGYSQNRKAYIILNKHTRKIKESLNVTFDETPPPSKTSPLVDDDLDEEEAINVTEKKKK
uniref:Retrovirus-related Pol polyprotein from transposon TNT 1-94 n=1 Tax=Tanacetum cinerariifolium TaxID=118510 RepID=A0A6L2JRP1_TANCI|nr:retrovirus-related Pol polyprotein from transposon TNT 1-94 [Tanacetum cinerariifolium]